MQKKTEASFLV